MATREHHDGSDSEARFAAPRATTRATSGTPVGRSGIVTLTTDFGLRDPYVGIVKGVLFGRAPSLRAVVDLTHAVPPQDVGVAAFQLVQAWPWFPAGTVHVAVVDPGVGSERAILAAERGGHLFLAPDNGLLGPVLNGPVRGGGLDPELGLTPSAGDDAGQRVHRVDCERFGLPRRSATFHGRDVFAPAAAALVEGLALEELGPALEVGELRRSAAYPEPRAQPEGGWVGEVLLVDHFGNALTNLHGDLAPLGGEGGCGAWEVVAGELVLPLSRTYAEVAPGEHLALVDSYGLIEVARRDGDASKSLGLAPGSPVSLRTSL